MELLVETASSAAVAAPAVSLHDLVEKAIAELKPRLNRDGGDIKLVRIEGDLVVIDLTGQCQDCVLASVTVAGIRKRLIEITGRPLRVVPLSAFTAVSAVSRGGPQ
jgi:Fe-S cluster biogenesis protein NfuA